MMSVPLLENDPYLISTFLNLYIYITIEKCGEEISPRKREGKSVSNLTVESFSDGRGPLPWPIIKTRGREIKGNVRHFR